MRRALMAVSSNCQRVLFLLLTSAFLASGSVRGEEIHCGEALSRQIGAAGETDTFTFAAQAGEAVSITVTAISDSLSPAWSLLGPDGAPLVSGCERRCEPSLQSSGTFTVEVFDSRDETGQYTIDLEPISATFNGEPNGPPSPVCARGDDGTQAIACGQALSRRIDAPGETDTFTFTAQAGEAVSIAVTLTSASDSVFPVWSLFGPDGASVIPNCGGRCQSSLQSGGTFTVEVVDLFGFGTGPYVIDLEAISATFNGEPNGPPTPTCT